MLTCPYGMACPSFPAGLRPITSACLLRAVPCPVDQQRSPDLGDVARPRRSLGQLQDGLACVRAALRKVMLNRAADEPFAYGQQMSVAPHVPQQGGAGPRRDLHRWWPRTETAR